MRLSLALLVVLLAALCPGWAGAQAAPRWKAVLVAGDDSIAVFDHAIDRLAAILWDRGVTEQRGLTSDSYLATADRPMATARTIEAALADLAIGGFDRCLVYLTSHGDRDGLLLKAEGSPPRRLTPNKLGRLLDLHCAEKPTVIVVSACHSGVFIAGAIMAPNRVILTAARDDKTSFGCAPKFELTYFDECVIDAWPKAQTWRDLFRLAESCIRRREGENGVAPSLPQAYFGTDVQDLKMP